MSGGEDGIPVSRDPAQQRKEKRRKVQHFDAGSGQAVRQSELFFWLFLKAKDVPAAKIFCIIMIIRNYIIISTNKSTSDTHAIKVAQSGQHIAFFF